MPDGGRRTDTRTREQTVNLYPYSDPIRTRTANCDSDWTRTRLGLGLATRTRTGFWTSLSRVPRPYRLQVFFRASCPSGPCVPANFLINCFVLVRFPGIIDPGKPCPDSSLPDTTGFRRRRRKGVQTTSPDGAERRPQ